MTDNKPNYTAVEPPEGTPPEEYTTHERRAEILQLIIEAGSPHTVKQTRLADRYGVHESTISRDMDRLRESVDEHLGADAKLTTRALFEKTVRDLRAADDWRAKKAAWDVAMDWNQWLADIGEQHREPDRSELDVDLESRSREISYTVVTGDGEALLGGGDEEDPSPVEQEELGFTSTPAELDVDTPGGDEE